MSNTIQSKPLADTPLNSTDIIPIVQGGVLKRTTVSVLSAVNEESGTFTPTYTAGGTNFDSVTYELQVGRYSKIGSVVFVEIRLRTSAVTKGSAAGSIFVSGLPFPVVTATASAAAVSIGDASAFLADHPCGGFFSQGTSTIGLKKRATSVSAFADLVVADIDTGAADNNLLLSGWYTTT